MHSSHKAAESEKQMGFGGGSSRSTAVEDVKVMEPVKSVDDIRQSASQADQRFKMMRRGISSLFNRQTNATNLSATAGLASKLGG